MTVTNHSFTLVWDCGIRAEDWPAVLDIGGSRRKHPFLPPSFPYATLFGGKVAIPLTEVWASRAESAEPLPHRWRPVDLVCVPDPDDDEPEEDPLVVRAKLIRNRECAAMCVSEAVSHAVFEALDLEVADPYSVNLGSEFAEDLSSQCDFDQLVVPGRHWGTRRMQKNVQEVGFTPDMVDTLRDEAELFWIFLGDVVVGNPDRRTHGNVLYAREPRARTFFLIPIDQSDCFNRPRCLLSPECLHDHRDDPIAGWLDGTQQAVLTLGRDFVDEAIDRVQGLKEQIMQAVEAPPDEWYDRADIEPGPVAGFLEYRVDNLPDLARRDHWMGLFGAVEGGYELDL